MNTKQKNVTAIVGQINPELVVVMGRLGDKLVPITLNNVSSFTDKGVIDHTKVQIVGFANTKKGYHKSDRVNSFYKEKAQSQRTRNLGSVVDYPEVKYKQINGQTETEIVVKQVQFLPEYNMITKFDMNKYLAKPKKRTRFPSPEAYKEYLATQHGIFFNELGVFPQALMKCFGDIMVLPLAASLSLGYLTDEAKLLLNPDAQVSVTKISDLVAQDVRNGMDAGVNYFTLDTPGVGQQREGLAVFIEHSIHPYEVFTKNGLTLDLFAKHVTFMLNGVKHNGVKFDASKSYKRNNLNDSSSIQHDIFAQLGPLKELEAEHYEALEGSTYMDEDGVQCPVLGEDGKPLTISTTVRVFEVVDPRPGYNKWKGKKIALADDMQAWVKIQTQVTKFEMEEGAVKDRSLELIDAWVAKNLTDGAVLAGEDFAKYIKQSRRKGKKMRSGIQFRLDPVGKGLMVFARRLEQMTGYELILFDGARKGDMVQALLDGTCVLSEMNETRDPEEEAGHFISSQAFYNFMFDDATVKELLARTLAHFKAAEIDMEVAKQMISAKALDFEGKEIKQVLEAHLDTILKDGEEVNTQSYLSANHSAEVPAALQKRVSDLLRAIQKRAKFGQQFVADSMMNHFVVDPFAVMQAMQKKRLYVTEDDAVIPADHFLVAGKGNEFRRGEAAIVRFPCLENAEIRKLMCDIDALPAKAAAYYIESLKRGYFKGLAIFSPFDMNPEGMSGADYDGDQGDVIFDEIIVSSFTNKPLFLDYSIIVENGVRTLISGCPPFGSSIEIPILNPAEFNVPFVQDGWNLTFREEDMINNPAEVYRTYHKLVTWNILVTMRPSSIGSYTNILMSVVASMMEIKNELGLIRRDIAPFAPIHQAVEAGTDYSGFEATDVQQYVELATKWNELHAEYAGYHELSQWFTAMVRWEIDAAKHGGAYKEHMQDILWMFDPKTPQDRLTYEGLMKLKEQGKDYSRLFLARTSEATQEEYEDYEEFDSGINYEELYEDAYYN